jgi:lipoyl(octanoyl) transferase
MPKAPHKNQHVHRQHWGLIEYVMALRKQESLQKEIIASKIDNQHKGIASPTPNYLIFCEHPHVYTLGTSGSKDHLLIAATCLEEKQINLVNTNRGGDITYHGPGQLVVYPILDLENFFTDIAYYLRLLEEAVMATLQDFDLASGRITGLTGVWIDPDKPLLARKICSIGIRMSRWVTMHGLALNVAPDLSYFAHIVPCGIANSRVTSMQQELNYVPAIQQVADSLQHHLVRLLSKQN